MDDQTIFVFPDPVLDPKESRLIEKLTQEYKKFLEPGPIGKTASKVRARIGRLIPEGVKEKSKHAAHAALELEYLKKVLHIAGKGFGELTKHSSRFTMTPEKVVDVLKQAGCRIHHYDHVCAVRSYHIEKLVSHNWKEKITAFTEGAVTGAPGIPGVPFNLVLSFFLFFRTTQNIALYYGYDVRNDPRELEIASEVTMNCLAPDFEPDVPSLGGHISRMMFAENAAALMESLKEHADEIVLQTGGEDLHYDHIRSLAGRPNEKGLSKAEQDGIEENVFLKLLEKMGGFMSQAAGRKAIPVIAAFVGASFDAYSMSRVLRGANLVYHKRFLFEKEIRVRKLMEVLE